MHLDMLTSLHLLQSWTLVYKTTTKTGSTSESWWKRLFKLSPVICHPLEGAYYAVDSSIPGPSSCWPSLWLNLATRSSENATCCVRDKGLPLLPEIARVSNLPAWKEGREALFCWVITKPHQTKAVSGIQICALMLQRAGSSLDLQGPIAQHVLQIILCMAIVCPEQGKVGEPILPPSHFLRMYPKCSSPSLSFFFLHCCLYILALTWSAGD